MYLTPGRSYYQGTEQRALRGWFLLLIQPNIYKAPNPAGDKWLDISATCSPENTYACVRRVALRQLGHFMMGSANLNGRWHTVSGAYGSDGLPMSVDKLPHDAVLLPPALYYAWKHGGGWNSAGSEATMMRDWARDTFKRQILTGWRAA